MYFSQLWRLGRSGPRCQQARLSGEGCTLQKGGICVFTQQKCRQGQSGTLPVASFIRSFSPCWKGGTFVTLSPPNSPPFHTITWAAPLFWREHVQTIMEVRVMRSGLC